MSPPLKASEVPSLTQQMTMLSPSLTTPAGMAMSRVLSETLPEFARPRNATSGVLEYGKVTTTADQSVAVPRFPSAA